MNQLTTIRFSKLLCCFLIFIILACNDSRENEKTNSIFIEENWAITARAFYTNTYRNDGLLDTTFQTTYYFNDENNVDSFNTIVLREYDTKKRLINEKTYNVDILSETRLTYEYSIIYDNNNNPVSETRRSGGELIMNSQYQYNNSGKLIQAKTITQNPANSFQ